MIEHAAIFGTRLTPQRIERTSQLATSMALTGTQGCLRRGHYWRRGTWTGTSYYLAKDHGITNVAVLEKGWLGGGNTGRNTTIIRSNYLWEECRGDLRTRVKLWNGPIR